MAEETRATWEGKATAKLRGATPDQVWSLLEDFCSFNKWLPTIDTCYKVEGVQGQPGLIRYCASTVSPSSDGSEEPITMWCHEKLLAIDPIERCLTYEVVENNMGFNLYKSTFKVLEMEFPDESSCQIKWLFVADPVEGWKFEELVNYIESSLQTMAGKMEKALQSSMMAH